MLVRGAGLGTGRGARFPLRVSLLGGVSVLALAVSMSAVPGQAVAETCLTDFTKSDAVVGFNEDTDTFLKALTFNSDSAVTGPVVEVLGVEGLVGAGTGAAGVTLPFVPAPVVTVTFTPVTTGEFLTGVDTATTADAITALNPNVDPFVDNITSSATAGVGAFACGTGADAQGTGANAFGTGAKADGDGAGAFGNNAEATGISAVAIGDGAKALANNAVAQGAGATAAGESSIAIGDGAKTKSSNAIALGTNTRARGFGSIAIGDGAETGLPDTPAPRAIAIGVGSNAQAQDSIAQGTDATAFSEGAIAIGTGAQAGENGNDAIAIGTGAKATDSMAIGLNATASGGGTAVGDESVSTGTHSAAYGQDAIATGDHGTALGAHAEATAASATAVGDSAEATAASATAVGDSADATAASATAVGDSADATAFRATATGALSDATGVNSSAYGAGAQANATNSAAFGAGAVANQVGEQAFGTADNTYTMGGITSDLSKSRQQGPLELVTTDAFGHLASDGGAVFEAIAEVRAGAAIAIAMEAPSLTYAENFGVRLGYGNFNGDANAIGLSAMGVLWRDESNRVALDIGVGLGWSDFQRYDSNTVSSARAGIQWTWK